MKRYIIIQILGIFICNNYAVAQTDTIEDPFSVVDTLSENFGLFADDGIMNITLEFDVTEFQRKRSKVDYLDAVLTYYKSDKDSIVKNVKLKSRGEFRNKNCNFPPIRLNFKQFEKDSGNHHIGKLKLVTHCKSGYEDNLLKEYLIYKLYNALTDVSFKVRLFRITYSNTRKKSKPVSTYAFVIEPVEFLAYRINAFTVDLLKLSKRDIMPEYMDRMAIFNYMIGNTDWSVPNQHNCKIFSLNKLGASSKGVIVPYDFDYTGFVDASYAIPLPELGITSVRQRLFQGICRDRQEYINALKEFSDKKDEFYRIINEFEYLDEKVKKMLTKYLDGFFDELDEKNSLVKTLLKECKD